LKNDEVIQDETGLVSDLAEKGQKWSARSYGIVCNVTARVIRIMDVAPIVAPRKWVDKCRVENMNVKKSK
jgi:hypothetical protein